MVTNFTKRQARITAAQKQKAYRDRKRDQSVTTGNESSYQSVTNGNTDKDIDKDKDKDIDKGQSPPAPHFEIIELFEALTQRSASMGGLAQFETRWKEPAEAIISYCGDDVELAKLAVTEAVRIHKRPDNSYRLLTVKSIQNTAMNWIDESKAQQGKKEAPPSEAKKQSRSYGKVR